jgi:hypothetical protein
LDENFKHGGCRMSLSDLKAFVEYVEGWKNAIFYLECKGDGLIKYLKSSSNEMM